MLLDIKSNRGLGNSPRDNIDSANKHKGKDSIKLISLRVLILLLTTDPKITLFTIHSV